MVESVGVTRRVPLPCTSPMPLSMETALALLTDHRSVADWPRSMEEGSTVKERMAGFRLAVLSVGVVTGGAGALAVLIGTFFLQATPVVKAESRKTAPTIRFMFICFRSSPSSLL